MYALYHIAVTRKKKPTHIFPLTSLLKGISDIKKISGDVLI